MTSRCSRPWSASTSPSSSSRPAETTRTPRRSTRRSLRRGRPRGVRDAARAHRGRRVGRRPAAWTDWRATLLDQLAVAVRDRLTARGPARRRRGGRGLPRRFWTCARRRRAGRRTARPRHRDRRSHRLDITDLDRVGLFADTAGLLAAESHTVRTRSCAPSRASRSTSGTSSHRAGPCPTRCASSGAWPGSDAATARRSRRSTGDGPMSPALGSTTWGAPGQARALVVPGASSDATVLEVRAQDRPGPAPRARCGVRGRGDLGALSAHRDVRRPDAGHLLPHRSRGAPLPPARVAQAVSLVIDTCDGI